MGQLSFAEHALATGLTAVTMCVPIFFGGDILMESFYLIVLVASSGRYSIIGEHVPSSSLQSRPIKIISSFLYVPFEARLLSGVELAYPED